MDASYIIEIDMDDEDIDMMNDIVRMTTIQIITHFLITLTNPDLSFFSDVFWKTTFYILMSIVIYWFVVRKMFSFKKRVVI
jgi:hypothetical protein